MLKRVYLDYAAATPVDERVKKAMDEFAVRGFANSSGFHQEGLEAKKALEAARLVVADFVGAKSNEIFFTSSTTESNNLAILGVARANAKLGCHLITTAVEHVSVLNVFNQLKVEGFKVTCLPVDEYGLVSAEQIKKAVRSDTILVSVIFASNEIGSINSIGQIGNGIKGKNGLPYFHTDAAQAAPHIKISVGDLGVDLMSFSSSKLYGPKGAAALYVRRGVNIEPVMFGGSQESGLRPGTQDLTGIVGFAKAVEITQAEFKKEDARFLEWRDKIIKEVRIAFPEILLNGHPAERLANNISFSVPGVSAEELVVAMDDAGFAISTRSACDAKSAEPPHVIKALGRSDAEARGTIRITLGRYTTEGDIGKFIEVFLEKVKKLKSRGF